MKTTHKSVLWARALVGKSLRSNCKLADLALEVKKYKFRPIYGLINLDEGREYSHRTCYHLLYNNYKRKESDRTNSISSHQKRCAKDKKYRAKMKRELKPRKVKSFKGAFEYINGWDKRKLLQISSLGIISNKFPSNCALVPISLEAANQLNIKLVTRGYDWPIKPDIKTHHYHESGETTWKNGRAVGYTRAKNVNYIQSVGLIVSLKEAKFIFNGIQYVINLSESINWAIDNNGIKIIRGNDDYHIEAHDIISWDETKTIAKLNELAKTRKHLELEKQLEEKSYEGLHINYRDSIMAGNCNAGTGVFVNRLGLDRTKHYLATDLLKKCPVDSLQRLRIAIKFAARRLAKEMNVGYSILSEHAFIST